MEIIRYLKATGLYYSDMVNNKERAEKARELMVTMFLDEEVQTALMEVTKDRSFMSFAKYMKVLWSKNGTVCKAFYEFYGV